MKKTLINILIIFVISNLYSIEKNENLELPKIPINVEGKNSNVETLNFKDVESISDAFYKLKIKKNRTIEKRHFDIRSYLEITPLFVLGGGTIGYAFDDNAAERDDMNEIKAMTYTGTIIGSVIGLIGAFVFYRYYYQPNYTQPTSIEEEYKLSLFEKDSCIKTSTLRTGESGIISNVKLEKFLDSVNNKKIIKYKELNLLLMKYNENFTNSFAELDNNNLSELYKPKGEFETTQQYEERIEREKKIEEEIQAEYEQELKIAEEKDNLKKMEFLKQIKEEIKDVEFTKSYDFELSDYNADQQSFTFDINGKKKKVVLPLMRAPKFKENISDYAVQKTFKPTLQGTWETVNDDYVLVNTKTDEIFPWEGSIPTIVEKSVENPPNLITSIDLIDSNGNGFLDAEENAVLKLSLINKGKGPALKTRISLLQESGSMLYYDVSKTVDEIQPGDTSTVDFSLQVPQSIKDGEVEFKIVFIEEQGFEPEPVYFTAETREMQKPELQVVDFGINDANGDGRISKGETSDITVRIQNIGFGTAKDVSVNFITNPLENIFIISDKSFEIGNLKSGDIMDITFTISTNNRVNNVVDIQVNVSEKRSQFSIEDKIVLEIEKTQKQLEPLVFKGSDEDREIVYANDLSIDIEQNIPQTTEEKEGRIAIIFGIEDYKNVSNVTFAHRDANFIKEYFDKTLGLKEKNIYFRANADVTKAEFDKVFSEGGWLDKRVKAGESEILFYYAGHGAPDLEENAAYLIPHDGDPNYAVQTGYKLAKIYDNLAKLKAKSVTVFLDACFSGANRENEMLLADARPLMMEVNSPAANGITVFSATSSKQISSAWPQQKHGLFSYFLMKGIKGDADINKDNLLSIKELGDYLENKVSEQAGYLDREQTPQLITDDDKQILINY